MRSDVLNNAWEGGFSRRASEEGIYYLLEKYGGDTDLVYDIMQYSKEGNTLPYAIQENIVANNLREAGYDAVLGITKRQGKPVFSELFDLREIEYPSKLGDFSLRDDVIGNRFISIESYNQAKQNIVDKTLGKLNAGIDPTILKD